MTENSKMLFLVLNDKRINCFLNALKQVFNDKKSVSNIHVTIRGPFKNRTAARTLNNLKVNIAHDVLRISGAGLFDNDGEYIVYLRIESPNLDKVWRKPDYPKSRYGVNPHITLYKGKDRNKAIRIHEFLDKEDINLLCAEYDFMFYDLKQKNLPLTAGEDCSFELLEDVGTLKLGVIDRAKYAAGVTNEAK